MRKLKLEELGRVSPETYKKLEKIPVVLLLDNIRSALNVGSIFRTADAYRLERLLLCGITAKPPHREILKTAIGAQDTVDWAYYEKPAEAAMEYREKGYKILGIEQTDESKELQQVTWTSSQPAVIALGNEVEGLHETMLPLLDESIELPQFGTKHSLNVAVCAGIVIWEFYWKFAKPA